MLHYSVKLTFIVREVGLKQAIKPWNIYRANNIANNCVYFETAPIVQGDQYSEH